jgi:radical SAM superfamily enzyme YgiQ (UPF0313 family)
MKILFIYSVVAGPSIEKPLGSLISINFGISYISSFLKKNGHQTELLILSRSFGKKNYINIKRKMEEFRPEIIGFYSFASQYKFISDISKFIKLNYPKIFLIIGGPHATLNPETVIEDSFDAVCLGEGEKPMLDLANMLEKNKFPSRINNLWIKKNSKIEKNQISPFLEDLDSLPFPDRTIWENYIGVNLYTKKHVSILLGRGCPHNCTYCCNHALSKITKGKYVRLRSPQNIIKELNQINDRYPFENDIYLEIECFNANKNWAIEVCNEIEKYNKSKDIPLSFGVNIRITKNADFDELFKACSRANIKYVNIGLESGSERVRKNILRRYYSNQDILNTVNSAKKYGLEYNFYLLIGLPGETIEDFKETIEICRICQPNQAIEHIYYPYIGTDLYKLCKEMNLLDDEVDIRMERMKPTINMPDFSKKQIYKNFIWFNYNVYKGYRPRIKLLLKVLLNILNSNFTIHSILLKCSQFNIFIKLKKLINIFLD